MWFVRWLQAIVFVFTLPLWPVFYLYSRMTARTCPKCGEDWYTELIGEWDGEDWKCHNCRHVWTVPYDFS